MSAFWLWLAPPKVQNMLDARAVAQHLRPAVIEALMERSMAWMKRMNARGNDIYIRPAGEHGLVLVDDLKPQALERMKAEGLAPAATIETSPGNYQAWVKLSDQPLSADVRSSTAATRIAPTAGITGSAMARKPTSPGWTG